MNPRTRQALGILGLLYAALMMVYNSCFFSAALSHSQWIGTGIGAVLSLGLIAEAARRRNTSKERIRWETIWGVVCGFGISRLLGTGTDYILGAILTAIGVFGLFRVHNHTISE